MIKVTELRIDNWITDKTTGETFQVHAGTFEFMEGIEENYEGIPLTPGIITDGLNRIDSNDLKDHIGDLIKEKNFNLHQFQNLIFALTGEEIEIKEFENLTYTKEGGVITFSKPFLNKIIKLSHKQLVFVRPLFLQGFPIPSPTFH